MPAEINVDYAMVATTASTLHTQAPIIRDELSGLLAKVSTLLGSPEGGLWLVKASPKMTEQYSLFTKSLQDAITNIGAFADSFSQITDALRNMDDQLSADPK